jgi:hypothetical protein
MTRRDFITLLGGATAWPLAARAQPGERMRRIGVLMPGDENDPRYKTRLSAFTQALADLGWTDGRNVRMIPIVFCERGRRRRQRYRRAARPPKREHDRFRHLRTHDGRQVA